MNDDTLHLIVHIPWSTLEISEASPAVKLSYKMLSDSRQTELPLGGAALLHIQTVELCPEVAVAQPHQEWRGLVNTVSGRHHVPPADQRT